MSVKQRNMVLLQAGELVRDLLQRSLVDGDTVLNALTLSAVKSVPGARFAAITLVDRKGTIQTLAPTHRYAVQLDDLQRRNREGPCLTSGLEHHIILIDDLALDQRWPRYRDDALASTPIRSILSLELFIGASGAGALNFYAEPTHVFGDESVELGLIFATHTALVLTIVRRTEEFRRALASRDIIGQAKGMLMERFNIDATHAWELIKRLSQNSNVPVADIARQLVEAGHARR